MVIDRVVEPRRHLHSALGGGHVRRVGIGGVGQLGEVRRCAHVVPCEPAIDRLAADTALALVRIRRAVAVRAGHADRAFAVLDHVGGVVDDDVHIHLHPARVGGGDEGGHVGIGAEMRVDLREVGDPVSVIARGLAGRRTLHRLVLEDRPEPDRGRAEMLDIVEPLGQALQVAAVIEALGGRIIAGLEPIAGDAAAIVARVGILEPVGEHEIDHLVLRRTRAVVGGRRYGCGAGQREQDGGGDAHAPSPASAAQCCATNAAWSCICATSRALSLSIVSMNSPRSLVDIASANGWWPAGIMPCPAST